MNAIDCGDGNLADRSMIARVKSWTARGAAACLVFLVAACFDAEHKVAVREDGSGQIRMALIFQAEDAQNLDLEAIIRSRDNQGEVRQYFRDGQFIYEHTINFNSLSDLSIPTERMAIEVEESGLLGFGGRTAVFERTIYEDASLPQVEIRIDGSQIDMLERMFADHSAVFGVTLPGPIEYVEPVEIGEVSIPGEQFGNEVIWEIPMVEIAKGGVLNFRVGFTAPDGLQSAETQAWTGPRQAN